MTSSSDTSALPMVPNTPRVVTACVCPMTAPRLAEPTQYTVIVTAAMAIAPIRLPSENPSNLAV